MYSLLEKKRYLSKWSSQSESPATSLKSQLAGVIRVVSSSLEMEVESESGYQLNPPLFTELCFHLRDAAERVVD